MFGYVIANHQALTQEQLMRYQSCYCGLCRTIGQTYGTIQRTALSYDITFLVLLESSLYEPEEKVKSGCCISHPFHSKQFWVSEATNYGAAMNMALAFYNCMDNWHDDKNLKSLLQGKIFQGSMSAIEKQYPRQCREIAACIRELTSIEKQNIQEPDFGANTFGWLMGELFVWREDRWSLLLKQMGTALGRFIYLTDALLDLSDDYKHHKYNPFTTRAENGFKIDAYIPVLKSLLGECTEAFEQLPLVQDIDIMRNILYSGIWTRFYEKNGMSGKEEHHV